MPLAYLSILAGLLQSPHVVDVTTVVGSFVSAGAGCYFGLKGAINGMRADVREIKADVRASKELLIAHNAKAGL